MNPEYFASGEGEQFAFYRVPKLLITDPEFRKLSAEAKLLYGLLLDRMAVSEKNNWTDGEGRIFIYFTIDEIEEQMSVGNKKAGQLLSELEKHELILRVRQGLGKPNRIYLAKFWRRDGKDPEGHFKKCPNDTSGDVETTLQDVSKRHTNKNNKSNTDTGAENRAGAAAMEHASAKAMQKAQIRRAYSAQKQSVYIPVISKLREMREERQLVKQEKNAFVTVGKFFEKHPVALFAVIIALIFFYFFNVISTAGSALVTQITQASVTETSFSAEEADIKGAEEDYQALEIELSQKLQNPEDYYSGYTNFEVSDAEVGHNPYELAALLTVLHETYTRAEVQDDLQKIFDLQYSVTETDTTGGSTTKTVGVGQSLGTVVTSGYCNCVICCGRWAGGPTASGVYPTANHTLAVDSGNPIVPMGTKIIMNGIEYTVEDTGPLNQYGVAFDVYYDNHQTAKNHGHRSWEAYIADDNSTETVEVTIYNSEPTLEITMTNSGIDSAARELLTDDEYERYLLIVEMKGNRNDLFADDIYANDSAGLDWRPAGEALSDKQFANMYNEAVKYLGVKYTWGGYSPDGFDCSGFVSYVVNHCGNGWNYGRLTANEWYHTVGHVSASEAKPGDLIFFQGTYATSGASHMGIYLGDGKMIHCGHPVQIASVDSPYFKKHFLGYGRLPSAA